MKRTDAHQAATFAIEAVTVTDFILTPALMTTKPMQSNFDTTTDTVSD